MKVSIRDWDEYSRVEAVFGYPTKLSEVFEVEAIISFDRAPEKSFIFCDRGRAVFHKAFLYNVLDFETPANWIRISYPKVRRIENPSFDFIVTIKEFFGPKEMIEDENFLFDLYENDDKAFDFIKNIKR